ncbi:hypothetical protein ACL1BV_12680, partial [Corynebacterium striatum]
QHQRIVVPPTSTMKENPLQYRVRGTPVPTTRTRGTNYPKSTPLLGNIHGLFNIRLVPRPVAFRRSNTYLIEIGKCGI